MKIGIIGGGIIGLTAAYHLSGKGHNVTVFEAEKELGGLASSFKLGDSFLERYYHHIFMSDRDIMDLISGLGLRDNVISRTARMGIFHSGKTYPFGTPIELLRFGLFGLLDKIRFGFTILYIKRLNNWKRLENISARDWMTRHAGKNVFNTIWKPLLEAKFGDRLEDISAAWLWGRIKARAESRSKGMIKEELGYLRGGFKLLVDALEKKITENRGRILKGNPVRRITVKDKKASGLICANKRYDFDIVISTVPLPIFLELAPTLPKQYVEEIKKIKYQAVVCMVLKLRKSLGNFYWLNISDQKIPFGLMAEHTNLVDSSNYGGSTVVYLSNYIPCNHRIYGLPDKDLFDLYKKGMKGIFPDFREGWIEEYRVFRDRHATPIYTMNYSRIMPEHKTPVRNLYLANTSQIYPEDRNMNNSIGLGRKIAKAIGPA